MRPWVPRDLVPGEKNRNILGLQWALRSIFTGPGGWGGNAKLSAGVTFGKFLSNKAYVLVVVNLLAAINLTDM
jgi:hypothetical protein